MSEGSIWSNEKVVSRLVELHKEGELSMSGMAAKLTQEFKITLTRNQIIGKCHRLGLAQDPRPRPDKPKLSRPPRQPRIGGGFVPPSTRSRVLLSGPKSFARDYVSRAPTTPFVLPPTEYFGSDAVFNLADRHCKWPIGNPEDAEFRFCNSEKLDGHSYCEHHHIMAYQASSSRPREATQGNFTYRRLSVPRMAAAV